MLKHKTTNPTQKLKKDIGKKIKQRKIQAGIFIFGLAIIGLSLLAFSKASSFSISIEPESAGSSISGGASIISDANASGGKYVKFNQNTTTDNPEFSLIVIPDVQQENANHPDKFANRMQWIVAQKSALNIRFVLQVGDLVDSDNCGSESIVFLDPSTKKHPQCNQTLRDQRVYWPQVGRTDHYMYKNADAGIKILDNAKIPYGLAIGNHDSAAVCGGPGCTDKTKENQSDWAVPTNISLTQLQRTTTTFNSYFPTSRVQNSIEKGFFEPNKIDNYYQTFKGGGLDWLALSLELWPRAEAVAWAKTVVANHPHHNVIIYTHSYITSNSGNIGKGNGGYGDKPPQYIFDNLVKVYPNIRFVFSGHEPTTAKREDTGVNGNKIYSFLDCYHDKSNNQTRVLKINTKNNTIVTDVYNNPAVPSTKRSDGSYNITGVNWVR